MDEVIVLPESLCPDPVSDPAVTLGNQTIVTTSTSTNLNDVLDDLLNNKTCKIPYK